MASLGNQELLLILNRARTLLSDPSTWSARHYAEDSAGKWIPVGNAQAVRFNLEGALVHAAGRDAREALAAILEIFASSSTETRERLSRTLPSWTHAEALALLDGAIAHLSFASVRKQSGTHLRAVSPDDAALPGSPKAGRG